MDWAFLDRDLKSFRVFLSFLLSLCPSEGRREDRRRNITKKKEEEAFIALQPTADRATELSFFKMLFAIISINIFGKYQGTLVSTAFIKRIIHVPNRFLFFQFKDS